MAWFKCFSHGGGTPTPSEWDMELYDLDFSSSDPYDEIFVGGEGLTVEFSIDTDAELYDNNNSFGFVTLGDAGHEPETCVRVVQFCMNKYEMKVFIRGRIYFTPPDSSDAQHIKIGEISGASRVFEGDYRNRVFRATFNKEGRFSLELKDENTGFFNNICGTSGQDVPDGWEEGHEGEWEYINHYYASTSINNFYFGSWYGGVGHHQFDGHVNFLKIKKYP